MSWGNVTTVPDTDNVGVFGMCETYQIYNIHQIKPKYISKSFIKIIIYVSSNGEY